MLNFPFSFYRVDRIDCVIAGHRLSHTNHVTNSRRALNVNCAWDMFAIVVKVFTSRCKVDTLLFSDCYPGYAIRTKNTIRKAMRGDLSRTPRTLPMFA